MAEPRRIMIAVDGSKHSEHAFQWYLANLFRKDDTVVFVSIIEPPNLNSVSLNAFMTIPADEWAEKLSKSVEFARKLEDNYSAECQGRGLKYEFHAVSHSNPGEGICQAVVDKKAQMIVMGSRGLSALRRTFMGSVSEYVLHHVNIPVTIVSDSS